MILAVRTSIPPHVLAAAYGTRRDDLSEARIYFRVSTSSAEPATPA